MILCIYFSFCKRNPDYIMNRHKTFGAYRKGFVGTILGMGSQRNMGIDNNVGLRHDIPRTVIASVSPSHFLACLYRIGFLDGADDLFWCELRAGWYAQLCLTKTTAFLHPLMRIRRGIAYFRMPLVR